MREGRDTLQSILKEHVPEKAIAYCEDIWESYPCNFKVTKERASKLGDYRYNPEDRSHTITVNHNLNKYAFLITYVHEFAHLIAREKHKNRISPHGKEWKGVYQEIMAPLLDMEVFPKEVLLPLRIHMVNPKASTYSDDRMVHALRKFDRQKPGFVVLSNLKYGDSFKLNNFHYTKLEKRRTRILCQQVSTSKKYLISKNAMVELLNGSSETRD